MIRTGLRQPTSPRCTCFLILAGLLLTPSSLLAQTNSQLLGGRGVNEVSLNVGVLSSALTYARRLGESRWHLGAGIWGAWEPPNSFDQEVWEPIGITAFGRYRAARWFHADVGLTAARYVWADDCSNCSGTLTAAWLETYFGRGLLHIGPQVMIGRAASDRHGAELGVIFGGHLRLMFGWE